MKTRLREKILSFISISPRSFPDSFGLESDEEGAQLQVQKWRVIMLLILASLVPLGFLGAGAWIVFGRIISDKSIEHLQTIVRDHAATVDLFLNERLMALDLVTRSYTRDQMLEPRKLDQVFRNLNQSYTNSFLDLGFIDGNGGQLNYTGPYDLLGKHYFGAPWFAHVSREGSYISDVFLGLRNVPHFIMAVRKDEGEGGFWILRATVNSEAFANVVSKGRLGATGDCFVVDRQGRYQTPPLSGAHVLEQSEITSLTPHDRIETLPALTKEGKRYVRTIKWIKNRDWMLVAQQEEAELDAPFKTAMLKGMAYFALGVVLIVLAAFSSTRYLFGLIETTTKQKEKLNLQLLRASKLASLGEMATGLAHEINNPLAIIATEQTNISDLLGLLTLATPETREMSDAVAMTKKQVLRCKEITQKMLQFGRQQKSSGVVLNPEAQLREIIKLLKQQARVNNVDVCLETEARMPWIHMDPTELQQLLANLVNNAVDAMVGKGAVVVSAWSEQRRFHLTVEDTGPGISEKIRDRIFEPFFTTKPVGKGTGLGLAVCYGIAAKWQGRIRLESTPGAGASFDVEFPIADNETRSA